MTRTKRTLLGAALLGLAGCGGGSSGDGSAPLEPVDGTGDAGAEAGEGSGVGEMPGGTGPGTDIATTLPERRAGSVNVELVGYRFGRLGGPAIALRSENDTGRTVYNLLCQASAAEGTRVLGTAGVIFADAGNIRPGQSATDEGEWLDLESFAGFESVAVTCDWLERDESAPGGAGVRFDFVEYTSDEFGRPAATMTLTNESGTTVYNALCSVAAVSGTEVLGNAGVVFANAGNVGPGQSAEASGTWFDVESLSDFDTSLPLDPARLECDYLVRS